MRWRCIIAAIASLLILSGCTTHQAKPPSASQELGHAIQVKVVDQTLLYRCQSFWSAGQFAGISQDSLEMRFKETYSVDAGEFEFSSEPARHLTITKCYIHGAITKSGNRNTADLLWLLSPYGLDFINDSFTESKTGLSWQGTANGISMSIKVDCPPQDCAYEAWQYPIGHCRGHIWWPAS